RTPTSQQPKSKSRINGNVSVAPSTPEPYILQRKSQLQTPPPKPVSSLRSWPSTPDPYTLQPKSQPVFQSISTPETKPCILKRPVSQVVEEVHSYCELVDSECPSPVLGDPISDDGYESPV